MSLTYKCACCGSTFPKPVKSIFGKEEAPKYCKNCSTERVCHACARHFIPSETQTVRIWQDDDGMVNRYSCSEECFKQRMVTCHRCRNLFPAEEAVELEGKMYCSEYCRDHVKCLWCQKVYKRDEGLNESFCSMSCEMQYYNVQDDNRKRMRM